MKGRVGNGSGFFVLAFTIMLFFAKRLVGLARMRGKFRKDFFACTQTRDGNL
jgi:hypothetical protein